MSGISVTVRPTHGTNAAPPDTQQVMDALDDVRRRIRSHAGDIEVVSITEAGEVTLAFTGACIACPAQAMTVGAAVLPAVEKVAGVCKISVEGMSVSVNTIDRIRKLFG